MMWMLSNRWRHISVPNHMFTAVHHLMTVSFSGYSVLCNILTMAKRVLTAEQFQHILRNDYEGEEPESSSDIDCDDSVSEYEGESDTDIMHGDDLSSSDEKDTSDADTGS